MTRFQHGEWSSPLLSRSVSDLILFTVATSVLGVLASVISFVEITNKEQASGYLVPATGGWTHVISDTSHGVIVALPHQSGDAVSQGDTLAILKMNSGFGAGETVSDRRLAYLDKQQLLHRDRLTMLLELSEMQREKRQLQQAFQISMLRNLSEKVESEKRLLALTQARHHSVAELHALGGTTTFTLHDAESQVEMRRLSLAGAEQELLRTSNQQAIDRFRLQETVIRDQLSAKLIETDLLNLLLLETEYQMEEARHILAPSDGVVASVRVHVGDIVQYGQALLDIIPEDPSTLEARLYVGSSAAAQLSEGDMVKLQVQGFPIESHGEVTGLVRSVSMTALSPHDAVVSTTIGDPVFQLEVVFPDGIQLNSIDRVIQLRPGMPVTADLALNKQTLLDWMIKPLQRAAMRI